MIPSRYMAIPLDAENKALKERIEELENSIEQIRAEIASHIGGCGYLNDGLDLALEIIDKYTK